jgi:hypothetical protein
MSSNIVPPPAPPPGPPAPQPPRPAKKQSWTSIIVLAVLVAGLAAILIPINIAKSAAEFAVEGECVRLVAEWAGVSEDQVTSESVGTSKVALDYRGAYPGGEWACGGERNVPQPYQVMVFPGGIDSETTIPEEIYSSPSQ